MQKLCFAESEKVFLREAKSLYTKVHVMAEFTDLKTEVNSANQHQAPGNDLPKVSTNAISATGIRLSFLGNPFSGQPTAM